MSIRDDKPRSSAARRLGAVAIAVALLSAAAPAAGPLVERPIVIAHRGASGYLPEHTMAAYRLAVEMGSDFIEPDLFLTADGVLVARHDRSLNATTNVEEVGASDPELAGKRSATGYNVDQLTYADIRKLNARSRGGSGYASPGNGYYDGSERFPIPTFGEVLDYVYDLYLTTGQVIGVYPEVKTVTGAPEYNRAIADAMLAALGDPKYGGFFDGSRGNVFLQSFDQLVVLHLDSITGLPVVFLTTCPATGTDAQLVATYAEGVGISRTGVGSNAACVSRAHAAGLLVHVYTLTNVESQYADVFGWGVDGIFGNHPDVNKRVRDRMFPLPDTTPPALQLPGSITAEATGPGGAVVTFSGTAADDVDGELPVTFDPPSGSTFRLGETVVTASATDAAGNTGTGTFSVRVMDTTAPDLRHLSATPNVLWPPTRQMVGVTVSAEAFDLVDPAPFTRIVSVRSNEPASGTEDGDVSPDWEVTGPLTLNLRAERAGSGAGRIYTIAIESSDASRNTRSGAVNVTVPRNQ